MKWITKAPCFGDMVRVKFGHMYHYGIYVSDADVVQFGLHPYAISNARHEDIAVISTNIEEFLFGGDLEACEFNEAEMTKKRTPDAIVAYAKSNLGRKGYNILHNNCEHFASECVFGRAYSSQTEDVRAMFRNLPIVDVFLAALPDECAIDSVIPEAKNEEIAKIDDLCERRREYCAWRLLQYALLRSLGLKSEGLDFSKNEYGKWSVHNCYFSVSYAQSIVAVVVSRAPVEISVKLLDDDSNSECFDISQPDTKIIAINNEKIICSINTKTPEKIRWFENVEESKYLN